MTKNLLSGANKNAAGKSLRNAKEPSGSTSYSGFWDPPVQTFTLLDFRNRNKASLLHQLAIFQFINNIACLLYIICTMTS